MSRNFNINEIEVNSPLPVEDREEWARSHACQFQQIFEQWQRPLGIDSEPYEKHLEKVLSDYWDDPLLKTLIEMI